MKISITIAVMALFLAGAVASVKEKPDVLFIAIDDMNDWTTLFDPANPIKTPNLERLAKRGAFFARAYCCTRAGAGSGGAYGEQHVGGGTPVLGESPRHGTNGFGVF